MIATSDSNTTGIIVQGGVSSFLVLYLDKALAIMIPFIILTGILIIVDLFFGVEAAKVRYEKTKNEGDRVRPSKALRKTVNKTFEYICWVILSATLTVTFEAEWINVAVMAFVVGNEVISIVDNYLYARGKKIRGLWDLLMKVIGKRVGEDLSDIKIEDIQDTAKDS